MNALHALIFLRMNIKSLFRTTFESHISTDEVFDNSSLELFCLKKTFRMPFVIKRHLEESSTYRRFKLSILKGLNKVYQHLLRKDLFIISNETIYKFATATILHVFGP